MRAVPCFLVLCASTTTMADPTSDYIKQLPAALARAADAGVVVAKLPATVKVTVENGGWTLTFPAIDTKVALAAWSWRDAYAVSGDVHQREFHIRRSTGPIAKDRIGTEDPTSGRWTVRVTLVERPKGALPKLVAGASPAYPLPGYASTFARIEIAPRDLADVVDALKAIAKPSMADVERELGTPDRDVGSGIHIHEYVLGKSAIRVGTADNKKVMYIRIDDRDVYRTP
jgi:hypothetical protein